MNNKKLIILIAFFSLMLQGCTSGGIFNSSKTPIGVNEENDIGNGIEMKISSIDDSNIESTGNIFFNFEMKNKNIDPIQISKNELTIATDISTSLESKTIFTSESISEFYNRIFKGEETIYLSELVYIDEEVSLEIDESQRLEFSPNLGQDIILKFKLEFEDKFEYFSNLNINFDKSRINSENVVKKKGPFELHSFELKSANSEKILSFKIKGFTNSQRQISFSNLDINFGEDNIECKQSFSNGNFIDRPTLGGENNELLIICDIPNSLVQEYLYDDTDFTFNVNLDYSFKEVILEKFSMPIEFIN